MSVLEIAANLVTAVSIFLAGRNSIHTWWSGILGAVLFGVLFYETQLYADATLQVFYVATSILGWVRWRQGQGGAELPVTRSSPRVLALAVGGGLVVAISYGALLYTYTDAYAPFWDSAVLVASVIAQLLLMNRKLESWYFWLVVNTIAVPLYGSRGLWLTAVLYVAYWVNALFALRRWRRDMA